VRRIPATLALLLASFAALAGAEGSNAAGEAPGEGYERLLGLFAELGPRTENGVAERAAFERIEETLRAAGVATTVSDFSLARGGYSASRIVDAAIPGERSEELVFVAPVSSWYDAATGKDGAGGMALALAAAERIARSGRKPPLTLRFVFLGAERRGREAEGEAASLGTRTWLASLSSAPPRAVVYLSLGSGASAIGIRNASKGRLSPIWLYDRARAALRQAGIPAVLEANRLQLYRLGLADSYGPASPYLEAGIPAIELRDAPGESAPIEGARLDSLVDALVSANAQGFSASWDLHYLIFQVGRLSATVRETAYVGFIVAFCAAVSLYILALTITRREAAKSLLARTPLLLWQAFALYAVLVAVFLAGNLAARLDTLVLGSGDAWRAAPRVFAAARLLASMLLFLSVISLSVARGSLTANPYFYEFVAVICLGVDVFAFSAVDLPMSFYFLWAFSIAGISLATRKGWATLAAYGLMYAPLLLVAADLAARPEYAAYARLVEPGAAGSVALAALGLPFFAFTASPLLFFAPRGALARRRTAAVLAILAAATEGAALVAALALSSGRSPAGGSGAGILVSERLDQDSDAFVATLKGRKRLGSGTLFRGGESLRYSAAGDECRIEGRDEAKRVAWSRAETHFLDRRTERLNVDFASAPYKLGIRIESEGELVIYDCDLPYHVALDGASAEIYAPVNPGKSISFAVTVPCGFRARIVVEAEYLDPLVAYAFPDGSAPRPGRFIVRSSASLGGGG